MTLEASATVHGALTVVNAIPTGRGAAIGIDLPLRADVELGEGPGDVHVVIEGDPAEDPRLVRAAVAAVGRHVGVELHGRVTTTSAIPVARGLKSSSACANAVVLAALHALDQALEPDAVLVIGIAAAREAGVTHTGALDDASASLLGGLRVTDNRAGRVLHHDAVDADDTVLILVPDERTYTRDAVAALASAEAACGRAHDWALDGRWPEALTLNGLATAAALGAPLGPAAAAIEAGATCAGMTGTGPATGAVCSAGAAGPVREALADYDGRVIEARPTNAGWEVAS